MRRLVRQLIPGLALMVAAGACAAGSSTTPVAVTPASTLRATPTPTVTSMPTPAPTTPAPRPTAPPVLASDGRPREARLSIPALGLERLRVRHYRGSPDGARGTRIQNGGIAASPYGPRGGTGWAASATTS